MNSNDAGCSCGSIRLSALGSRVGPSPFSSGPLHEVMRMPGAHVLAQGVPPLCTLPLKSVTLNLSDGSTVQLDTADTCSAQRYAPFGWSTLRSWLHEHIERMHHPPCADWGFSLIPGSMAGLDLVFRLVVEAGDVVLIEEFTFMAAKDLLRTQGAELLPVRLDSEGLIPGSIEEMCESRRSAGLPMPKALYTIPVGQNPTGSRLAPCRYEEIYALARRYGFVIVEDDPYY